MKDKYIEQDPVGEGETRIGNGPLIKKANGKYRIDGKTWIYVNGRKTIYDFKSSLEFDTMAEARNFFVKMRVEAVRQKMKSNINLKIQLNKLDDDD